MITLINFLDAVENIEPGLYDVLNGDEARRELAALLEGGSTVDGTVLIAMGGIKQSLIEEMELAPSEWSERENETIPFVIVKGTTPLERNQSQR